MMNEQILYRQLRDNLIYLEHGSQVVLQAFGLTVAQYDALLLLSLSKGWRMGELGKRLLCDNSKMTRIIDHLVGKGLAERRQDSADRRALLVFLLQAGADLREQAAFVHQSYLKAQFSIFTEKEQGQLASFLERLKFHIRNGNNFNE